MKLRAVVSAAALLALFAGYAAGAAYGNPYASAPAKGRTAAERPAEQPYGASGGCVRQACGHAAYPFSVSDTHPEDPGTKRISADSTAAALWSIFTAKLDSAKACFAAGTASPSDGAAVWRARLARVATDPTLNDSLRVVRFSQITYNCAYYYRTVSETELDEFLALAMPAADRLATDDAKIWIYAAAVFMARSPGRNADAAGKLLYYTENGRSPRARLHGWVSLGHLNIGNSESLKYFFNALYELRGTDDPAVRALVCRYISQYYREQMDFGNSLRYALLSLEAAVESGDTDEPQAATECLTEALEIAVPIRMIETAAFCYKQLGLICHGCADYAGALDYYRRAGELLEGEYYRTPESDHLAYELLLAEGSSHRMAGNWPGAARSYREGIARYRAVFDAETLLKNQILAAGYENARQEEELGRMETMVGYRRRQSYIRLGVILVWVTALACVLLAIRYRIKVVAQKEQRFRDEARRLELEKGRAELLVRLKQQEAEELKDRIRMGHRLVGMRNAMLADLRAFLEVHGELTPFRSLIEGVILSQNRVEGNINSFRSEIPGVPPDFQSLMQLGAGGKLTALDVRYCRLIYLGTSTREMASLLCVEPRSVRMNRYRLKRKFGLGRGDDLCAFIRRSAAP